MGRVRGKHIQGIMAKTRKAEPLQRPKNERPFKSCKVTMKKFFKKPSKKTYAAFERAYNSLLRINPSQANVFKALFKKEMFDRAFKEENFK